MIRQLVCSWLLLGVLCAWTSVKPDPYGLQSIVDSMEYPGVVTKVKWVDCWQVNAFYDPRAMEVQLCNELKPLPKLVIQGFLAHELAHGVIFQRGIPYTGSEEFAADELAFLVLHLSGRDDVLRALADFYANSARPEHPRDPHPSDNRRVFMAQEMSYGLDSNYYRRVLWAWATLLEKF